MSKTKQNPKPLPNHKYLNAVADLDYATLWQKSGFTPETLIYEFDIFNGDINYASEYAAKFNISVEELKGYVIQATNEVNDELKNEFTGIKELLINKTSIPNQGLKFCEKLAEIKPLENSMQILVNQKTHELMSDLSMMDVSLYCEIRRLRYSALINLRHILGLINHVINS